MEERTKKFILGMTGYSLFILVAKAVLAGLVQATAAFLAKYHWEKWNKRR